MSSRLAPLLFVLTAIPAISQQASLPDRISQRVDAHEQRLSQVANGAAPDPRATQMLIVRQDMEELSALSATVQAELQQLRKGLLAKDLDKDLKRMEKLSKKLRRDMQP
jgi:hypothetical protein